jgi:hypothetical protein
MTIEVLESSQFKPQPPNEDDFELIEDNDDDSDDIATNTL